MHERRSAYVKSSSRSFLFITTRKGDENDGDQRLAASSGRKA